MQLTISQQQIKNNTMNFNFDEFLLDGENFFEESNFHLERTYEDFVDYNDKQHSENKPENMNVIYGPSDNELMKKLIGHKGYNFISATEKSGIDKIWHNKATNIIEFTGGTYKQRVKAIKMLDKKLKYYTRGRKMKNMPVPLNFVTKDGGDNKHVPGPLFRI